MSKSIVLACYEVPGYGGASTATYQLFQRLRRETLEVTFVNLIDGQDVDYFRFVYGESFGNPQGLSNVTNLVLDEPLYGAQPGLADLLVRTAPDLMIGVDSIATLLLKKAAPHRKVIFMIAGCQTAQDLIFRDGRDYISHEKVWQTQRNPKLNTRELQAVELSDLVIAHSDLTHALYQMFYPSYAGKLLTDVIWFAEWIYAEALSYAHLMKPFDEREIDVLFVASSWSRQEKNYALVEKLARELKHGVHIVGEVDRRFPNATYHGLATNRQRIFELMANARTVACPSLFEAAPGILFEASAMGCNVVASRNCGNWQLCHEQLLVNPMSLTQFVKAVELSLTRKFDDQINFFLQARSYHNLVETIAVM